MELDQGLGAGKKQRQFEFMLFGVGHFYYPNSRYSIGIQVLNRLAAYHQLEWQVREDLASFVAEGKNFVLVKPRTNGPLNNYKSLRACLRNYREISPDNDLIVCHHDIGRDVGTMAVNRKYWGETGVRYQHESLYQIENHTRLIDYTRVAIGISPPEHERMHATISNFYNGMTEAKLQRTYIYNKFPTDQVSTLDSTIFADMEHLTDKIFVRAVIPQYGSITQEAYRPESTVVQPNRAPTPRSNILADILQRDSTPSRENRTNANEASNQAVSEFPTKTTKDFDHIYSMRQIPTDRSSARK